MKSKGGFCVDKKLKNIISTIREKQKEGNNIAAFAFASDNSENKEKHRRLVERVMDKCNITFCFYTENRLEGFESHRSFCRLCNKNGEKERGVYSEISGAYYYVDDELSRVRHIILTPHRCGYNAESRKNQKDKVYLAFGQNQLEWLCDTLCELPRGYAVSLFSLYSISDKNVDIRDSYVASGIINAFIDGKTYVGECISSGNAKNNVCIYTSFREKGDVIGWFAFNEKSNTIASYKNALCENQGFKVVNVSGAGEYLEYGADDSFAVDFVVVNRESGEIYLARLGSDSDRSYNYLVDYI